MLKDSLKVAEGELLMAFLNYGSCVSLYQPARRDVPTSAVVAIMGSNQPLPDCI